MTTNQLKGMLKFHRSAYQAYKRTGQTKQAKQARVRMIETYLAIRQARTNA